MFRWCASVHLGCSVCASEGEGDGPQASVSLCVSLGVSQSGSGCGDGVLAGVCFESGAGECRGPRGPNRAGVLACPAVGSRRAPLSRLGPRCPDSLSPAPSYPLSHKDFFRWRLSARHSLAGNCSEPTGGGDSEDLRARGPVRGGLRRRPAERRVPGDPGPRARRPERPPSRPAFPAGLIAPLGVGGRPGPVPSAPTACAPARERCPADSAATLSRAPAASRRFRGSQAAVPRPQGARPGVLGWAAQVRRPQAQKPDPWAGGLRRHAPRR